MYNLTHWINLSNFLYALHFLIVFSQFRIISPGKTSLRDHTLLKSVKIIKTSFIYTVNKISLCEELMNRNAKFSKYTHTPYSLFACHDTHSQTQIYNLYTNMRSCMPGNINISKKTNLSDSLTSILVTINNRRGDLLILSYFVIILCENLVLNIYEIWSRKSVKKFESQRQGVLLMWLDKHWKCFL